MTSTGEVAVSLGADGERQARFIYLANAQIHSAFVWRDEAAGVATTTLRLAGELWEILLLEVPFSLDYSAESSPGRVD